MSSISRALVSAMLDTAPFNTVMDLCFLKVYSGTVPANATNGLPDAEAAIGSATLLCTYTNASGETGLTWEAAAVNGVIQKTATEVWSGVPVAGGSAPGTTATFYRIVLTGDDGTASTTAKRIQGTVGVTGADLLMADPNFVTGVERSISAYSFSGLSES